jgi:DNA-directed RNA polymerase specialized sigma24 family protein
VTKAPPSPQYVVVKEPPSEAPFDAIYERELDYVWRSLGRLGVRESDLADAVHEVFLVLHRRWNEIDRHRSLRPWLFGVARRVAAAARAKQREDATDVEIAETADPLVAQRRLLWRALAKRRRLEAGDSPSDDRHARRTTQNRDRRLIACRNVPDQYLHTNTVESLHGNAVYVRD